MPLREEVNKLTVALANQLQESGEKQPLLAGVKPEAKHDAIAKKIAPVVKRELGNLLKSGKSAADIIADSASCMSLFMAINVALEGNQTKYSHRHIEIDYAASAAMFSGLLVSVLAEFKVEGVPFLSMLSSGADKTRKFFRSVNAAAAVQQILLQAIAVIIAVNEMEKAEQANSATASSSSGSDSVDPRFIATLAGTSLIALGAFQAELVNQFQKKWQSTVATALQKTSNIVFSKFFTDTAFAFGFLVYAGPRLPFLNMPEKDVFEWDDTLRLSAMIAAGETVVSSGLELAEHYAKPGILKSGVKAALEVRENMLAWLGAGLMLAITSDNIDADKFPEVLANLLSTVIEYVDLPTMALLTTLLFLWRRPGIMLADEVQQENVNEKDNQWALLKDDGDIEMVTFDSQPNLILNDDDTPEASSDDEGAIEFEPDRGFDQEDEENPANVVENAHTANSDVDYDLEAEEALQRESTQSPSQQQSEQRPEMPVTQPLSIPKGAARHTFAHSMGEENKKAKEEAAAKKVKAQSLDESKLSFNDKRGGKK